MTTDPTKLDAFSVPPCDTAAVDAAPSASTPKTPRYVGRITLGIALVFVGAVITLSLFLPGQHILLLFKLLPLILVALGLEILISAARYKDRSVKVGFGLTLLSLLLILGSVVSAILPSFWHNYGPSYWSERQRAEQELKDSIYTTLDRSLLDRVTVSVQHTAFSQDFCAIVHIDLLGDYADESAFAETVTPMVQSLAGMGIEALHIYASNPIDSWTLDLDGAFIQSNTSIQELTPRIEHNLFYLDEYANQVSSEAYTQMVEQGLLVSADLVVQARQEGWDEGYQQGISQQDVLPLPSESDTAEVG